MYHIIINPASRSGKGRLIWKEQIEPALQRDSVPFQAYFSEKAGDVIKLAKNITEQTEESMLSLIILGGDGTLNEAIQGIRDFSKVTLGYIPTGSSNDLARDLGISFVPTVALDCILHTGCPHSLDIGTVTYENGSSRRFVVSCGIGYDAAICEEALHSRLKNTLNRFGLGKLTYVGIALKQLITTKKVSAKLYLDNRAPISLENMLFTACMLHRYEGGGFMFCPDANPADGIINLCAVGDISKALVVMALPSAMKGKHYRFQGITPHQAEKIVIEASTPLWIHTDGEVTRKSKKITVSCNQQCLNMIY